MALLGENHPPISIKEFDRLSKEFKRQPKPVFDAQTGEFGDVWADPRLSLTEERGRTLGALGSGETDDLVTIEDTRTGEITKMSFRDYSFLLAREHEQRLAEKRVNAPPKQRGFSRVVTLFQELRRMSTAP